jgi:diamine N-acetyltransferase
VRGWRTFRCARSRRRIGSSWPYFLWRLLIDARRQGRGLGSSALDLVVAYVRTRTDAETLLTSVVPGPAGPVGFYLRYGFSATGRVFDGEDVLELPLPAVA